MFRVFSKLRRELLVTGGIYRYLSYAFGEILLVVIGILLALQVNDWAQAREDAAQELFILERIDPDLADDQELIAYQISKGESFIADHKASVDILLGKREASLEQFKSLLRPITTIIIFQSNATTFEQIIATGNIDLISNQFLSDAVIRYYTRDLDGWESALRTYSRDVIKPFLLGFDHRPHPPQTSTREDAATPFTLIDVSSSAVRPKTLDDYRNSVSILNILRTRIYTLEGQVMEYRKLRILMDELRSQIQIELSSG